MCFPGGFTKKLETSQVLYNAERLPIHVKGGIPRTRDTALKSALNWTSKLILTLATIKDTTQTTFETLGVYELRPNGEHFEAHKMPMI